MLARLDRDLTSNHEEASDITSTTGIKNAYDFMTRRREVTGDPGMERWNAAIRLANFASLESAPLCVSHATNYTKLRALNDLCVDVLSRRTSRFPDSRTSSRGTG